MLGSLAVSYFLRFRDTSTLVYVKYSSNQLTWHLMSSWATNVVHPLICKSFFEYSLNHLSSNLQVRFCSSFRSSRMSSEVVPRSLLFVICCYRLYITTSVFSISNQTKIFHTAWYIVKCRGIYQHFAWIKSHTDLAECNWFYQLTNYVFCLSVKV